MRNSQSLEDKILFFSITHANYSRSEVLLTGQQKQSSFIEITRIKPKTILMILRALRKERPRKVVVCSPSHVLVPIIRCISMKQIVLDAGWPLSDSNYTRNHGITEHLISIKNFLVDFLAFHLSDCIIVESFEQKKRIARRFLISSYKLKVVYTGVHEMRFFEERSRKPSEIEITEKPLILFRGKYNAESGLDNIVKACEFIDEEVQVVIATDSNFDFTGNSILTSKILLIKRTLQNAEIDYLYRNCIMALGQLSTHPRVAYTIPHKFFEAAFFGVPYVTMKESAAARAAKGSGLILLENSNPELIAETIIHFIKRTKELKVKTIEMKKVYENSFQQDKLQRQFSRIIT